MPGNSQDFELIEIQIEKQRLEIQDLELGAQGQARSLLSPSIVKLGSDSFAQHHAFRRQCR